MSWKAWVVFWISAFVVFVAVGLFFSARDVYIAAIGVVTAAFVSAFIELWARRL